MDTEILAIFNHERARIEDEYQRISHANVDELIRQMWEYIYNSALTRYPDDKVIVEQVIKKLFDGRYLGVQGPNLCVYLYVGHTLPFLLD